MGKLACPFETYHTNNCVVVLGDSKSSKELAEIYEKVYGATAQLRCLGTLDDLYAKMMLAFKAQPHNQYAWMSMFYTYYMANGSTLLGKLDNERYPALKPLSVEAFLKRYTKETVANSAFF